MIGMAYIPLHLVYTTRVKVPGLLNTFLRFPDVTRSTWRIVCIDSPRVPMDHVSCPVLHRGAFDSAILVVSAWWWLWWFASAAPSFLPFPPLPFLALVSSSDPAVVLIKSKNTLYIERSGLLIILVFVFSTSQHFL